MISQTFVFVNILRCIGMLFFGVVGVNKSDVYIRWFDIKLFLSFLFRYRLVDDILDMCIETRFRFDLYNPRDISC